MPPPRVYPAHFVPVRINISDIAEELVYMRRLIDFINWFRWRFTLPCHLDFEGQDPLLVVKIPQERLEYVRRLIRERQPFRTAAGRSESIQVETKYVAWLLKMIEKDVQQMRRRSNVHRR